MKITIWYTLKRCDGCKREQAHHNFPYNVLRWDRPDDAAVGRMVAVVAHQEDLPFGHDDVDIPAFLAPRLLFDVRLRLDFAVYLEHAAGNFDVVAADADDALNQVFI